MEYKVGLKGLFLFELRSWLGRSFKSNKPKLSNNENYLHLGCGANYLDGYINADFFRGGFWKKKRLKIEWELDFRYPLNCSNNTFDGIFTEHTLEHLYPDDAKRLLAELFRVLKPEALIRITVPDLEKYVKFYTKKYEYIDVNKFNEQYPTGCSAIRNTTQNYLHFSAWDFEELKRYLEEVGFRDVKKMEFGKTQNEKLNLDLQARAWETLYLEAIK